MKWLIGELYALVGFDKDNFDFYDLYYLLDRPCVIRFEYDGDVYTVRCAEENGGTAVCFDGKWYRTKDDFFKKAYIREFGDLMTESFQLKIECIALKKEIALYIKAKNAGSTITGGEVKRLLEVQMSGYYEELDSMIKQRNASKQGRPISNYEAEQIKKLYRKLAKLLHPDISPLTADHPALADYFNRIILAYKCNDLKELRKLEVLVNKELEKNGIEGFNAVIPDAAERIEELSQDIDMIISSEPYTYKYLLEDDDAVDEKKRELEKEIEDYSAYKAELTARLEEIKGGM